MDFSTPFSYPFKDPDWLKKIAIAGLVSLIPIVGWLYLFGWGLEITRQIIKDEAVVIPGTEFGKFVTRGLKAWVVGIVYAIPSVILQIPNTITNIAAQTASNDDGSGAVLGGLAIVTICTSILSAIYSLVLAFIYPAVYANFVAHDDEIGAGLRFAEIFGLIKKVPMAYLLALIGTIIASVISGLGLIACIIGVIFTIAYSILIMFHFYGQAYREATK
jgi:predicted PurR-regulated permease PerM